MNLYCGCLICCYLFCLFLFFTIISHLLTLCNFNSSEIYYWSRIRVPPGGGVLICQLYLLLLKYHHKSSLHLPKSYYRLLLHSVIYCHLDRNDSWWLLITTLLLDDHHRLVGTCHNQLNRCKCLFCNMIYDFRRFLDGGYTCLCIFYHVGRDEGEETRFRKSILDYVASWYNFMWWGLNLVVKYFSTHLALEML